MIYNHTIWCHTRRVWFFPSKVSSYVIPRSFSVPLLPLALNLHPDFSKNLTLAMLNTIKFIPVELNWSSTTSLYNLPESFYMIEMRKNCITNTVLWKYVLNTASPVLCSHYNFIVKLSGTNLTAKGHGRETHFGHLNKWTFFFFIITNAMYF